MRFLQDCVYGATRITTVFPKQSELYTLPSLNLVKIDLKYKQSNRTDENGNDFRYRAKVWDLHGAQINRWAWDVFLSVAQH